MFFFFLLILVVRLCGCEYIVKRFSVLVDINVQSMFFFPFVREYIFTRRNLFFRKKYFCILYLIRWKLNFTFICIFTSGLSLELISAAHLVTAVYDILRRGIYYFITRLHILPHRRMHLILLSVNRCLASRPKISEDTNILFVSDTPSRMSGARVWCRLNNIDDTCQLGQQRSFNSSREPVDPTLIFISEPCQVPLTF